MINRLFKLMPLVAIIVLLLCLFSSCSHQSKLARAKNKKIDVDIPEIKTKVKVNVDTNTAGIDSLFKEAKKEAYNMIPKEDTLCKATIDSLLSALNKKSKTYLRSKPCIRDTITQIKDGITVKVYQTGSEIEISIHKPAEVKQIDVPVAINTINPVKEVHVIKWWDWLSYCFNAFILILFFLDYKFGKRAS